MKVHLDPYDVCRRYLRDVAGSLTSELRNKFEGWLRSRDLNRLASCTSLLKDCTSYSVFDAKAILQVAAFFKKNSAIKIGQDTKLAALESFQGAETTCSETNARIVDLYFNPEANAKMVEILSRAARYIESVLSDFDVFFSNLPWMVRVTSGASSTRPLRESQPYRKISTRMQCTSRAAPYVVALTRSYGWDCDGVEKCERSRVITVPKNWKTDRTIACEPDGNLPLQLAFDTYCKGRLMRFGLNLSDQLRNQQLAKEGSIDGQLATVDLSQASDTLSRSLVAYLLHPKWYRYLDDVRSPLYTLGRSKQLHIFEKFSSMGNGATFTLETLIFASLCHAVGSRRFSVYGDDIIVESELVEELTEVLNFCGFSLNLEKSYWTGPYRESCGKHWFNGTDITPLYFRSSGSSKGDLSMLVNYLVDLGSPEGALWELAKETVVSAKLLQVPRNADPTTGVFIDATSAYSQKLIVLHKPGRDGWSYVPHFKGYGTAQRRRRVPGPRSRFLWHLNKAYRKYGRVRSEQTAVETTLVPFTIRRVRKWVVYIPVYDRWSTAHLNWWAEYLNRFQAV